MNASVTVSNQSGCTASARFNIENNPNHTQLQISLDGGETYTETINDNVRNGNVTFNNVPVGTIIYARWRGQDSGIPVGFVDNINNNPNCKVNGSDVPDIEVNVPPTGSFLEPSFSTIEQGYEELYVNVEVDDENEGDRLNVTLRIDGEEIRTEGAAPFEFGHNPANPDVDLTFETLGLEPGNHLFEAIISDDKGASTTITRTITVIERKGPFNNRPTALPGTIEAEHFDFGGQGVSYNDNDPENIGAADSEFRLNDGVDIATNGSVLAVGWTRSGEWLEYTIDVESTDSYNFDFVVAAPSRGGQIGIDIDGETLITGLAVPPTGDWGEYDVLSQIVTLEEGVHVLRLNIENNGFNIDRIDVSNAVVTSIFSNVKESDITVFPNPSEDGIFHMSESQSFKVLDVKGSLIQEGEGDTIDLSSESKGVYILQVGSGQVRLVR